MSVTETETTTWENRLTPAELRSVAERIRARSARDPEILPGHTIGCLLWKGGKTGAGRGAIKFKGASRNPARLMYLAEKGPIPPDLVVCHSCDHELCVEPEHLRAGTQQENMNDMVARGRSHRDFDDPTIAMVWEYALRGLKPSEIARKTKMSRSYVDCILTGEAREAAVSDELDRVDAETGRAGPPYDTEPPAAA